MVNKELLDILCCPETKQDVEYIDGDIISLINKKIKKGQVQNRSNEVLSEPIDAGLLRKDRKFLYPIQDDIPIMLIEKAIPFEQFDS